MTETSSAAMTADLHEQLCAELLRPDGQEDIRLITYAPSTGGHRRTGLLRAIVPPRPGDRAVHGNASITSDYILNAVSVAQQTGHGIAMAHSHPTGRGWQNLSWPDRDAESSYANLVREMTGHALVGLTLAGGDQSWSARHWDHGYGTDITATQANNVRRIGDHLTVTWNDSLVPPPPGHGSQLRTISAWGPDVQRDLIRRRVLVVGLGSIGLDIAARLATTGLTHLGLMDFDVVEPLNLDRLIGATALDALLGRRKIDVAERVARTNATAPDITIDTFDSSICEPAGQAAALDYDIIFCCVDRPWPRAVLNQIAYTDLIPVIDGGIAIDAFADGGIRNATWRTHVVAPGRPCLVCNHQIDPGQVSLDISGLLNDPTYIAGTADDPAEAETAGANVSLLSIGAAASQLAQYVSLNTAPGGLGDPGPLQFLLSTHTLEHLSRTPNANCPVETQTGAGDQRIDMTGDDPHAERQRAAYNARTHRWRYRALRYAEELVLRLGKRIELH